MTSAGERRVCGTLLHLGTQPADLPHGSFRIETFLNLSTRGLVLVLCHGDIGSPQPLLARVHSSCMTSETFGGCDCDCAGQLDAALEAIGRAGRGVVFYLLQEGRGAGFIAKARDRMMVQASRDRVTTFDAYARMGLGRDYRRYDDVAFAAAALGIGAPLVLLSNNPDKVEALRRANVTIADVLPLERAASPFNLHYLTSKSRSGHALSDPVAHAVAAAALPEQVAYFDPHPVAEWPRFVRVASYLLPIRALPPSQGVHWFRLHAFFDLAIHRERVLFTYARNIGVVPLVRVERESLLARFPLGDRRAHMRWREAVERIVARGAGCALFVLHDDPVASADQPGAAVVAEDDALAWLLARHVAKPAAELLTDEGEDCNDDAALVSALGRHGVVIDAR
jgi:3,4-dihydroxy 2-butanone 4-phosphate synthase/GTP cyclohydrolase II